MEQNKVAYIAVAAIPVIFSIIFHEVAHGWMAYKLGDSTAKEHGRLTLNPVAHIDPMGTILLPIITYFAFGFFFGSAKPVPFNPYRFYNHINMRKGTMWVAAAGPLSNLILAIISAFGYVITARFFPNEYILTFFYIALFFNVLLGFFNMVPIPPLDGSKVFMGFLPREYDQVFFKIERYGFFIIIALAITGAFRYILLPVSWITGALLYLPNLIFFG
ncbi:MAG: site-2 protease family protein [bacterium]